MQKYNAVIETTKKMGAYLNSLSPKEKEWIMKGMAIRMILAAELLKDKEMPNA